MLYFHEIASKLITSLEMFLYKNYSKWYFIFYVKKSVQIQFYYFFLNKKLEYLVSKSSIFYWLFEKMCFKDVPIVDINLEQFINVVVFVKFSLKVH